MERPMREWREIPIPDLPAELLPPDWQGHVARRLFLEYHRRVSPAALAHFGKLNNRH